MTGATASGLCGVAPNAANVAALSGVGGIAVVGIADMAGGVLTVGEASSTTVGGS